jgi:transcriptional regulator with XRE-family HTH domain
MSSWNRHNPIATFVRNRRKSLKLTQIALSDYTGLGLRFIRDLEQGKPNLMTHKVNELLLFFDHELAPKELKDEKSTGSG